MRIEEKAMMVAEKVHNGQSYDIYPYIYHVKRVLEIAESMDCSETIKVACILHDTIEDSGLSYNDIKKIFGHEVAEIVYAVTDELGRNRKERKSKTYPKIRSNWKAIVVKICDRIANVNQSKQFNPGLFKMYQEEHESFKEALITEDAKYNFTLKKSWELLELAIK